jgi:amidase
VHPLLLAVRSLLTGMRVAAGTTHVDRLRPLDLGPFRDDLEEMDPARAAEVDALLDAHDVAGLSRLMAHGELTSLELTLGCLARVRAHDDRLRSFVELDPTALEQARAADARRRAGRPASALDGIPVSVKDNIETAGPTHTTVGAVALAEHVAAHDAPLVAAVRAAGLVVLGKGNLSELAGAMSNRPGVSAVGGFTLNPHGAQFSPGGSSSGAGAAVAAGLVPLAIGTETSGSLVVPASFTGVATIKPSVGVVPTEGVAPLVAALDCPGPVARSVAEAALLLSVLADPPLGLDLAPEALAGRRLGVLRADVLAQKSPFEDTADNAAVLDRVVAAVVRAGAEVVDVDLATVGTSRRAVEKRQLPVILAGLRHETGGYLARASGGSVGGRPLRSLADLAAFNLAEPRRRMPTGQTYLALALGRRTNEADHHAAAVLLREDVAADIDRLAGAAGVDAFLSLSTVHAAVYASAGLPAVSVPAGLRTSGMPVGALLFGARRGDDALVVALAAALERELGPRPVPRTD